jgi:hypothetical protein
MKLSQAMEVLTSAIEAGVPVFLWGPPGIGKTDGLDQVSAATGRPLVTMIASQSDPTDTKGLLHFGKDSTECEWLRPSDLPKEPNTIWFWDEFNTAPIPVRNSLLNGITKGRVGTHKLPAGTVIVAAGNRETDGAYVSRLSKPMESRFLHLEITPDLDDWTKWATSNNVLPDIVAFVRWRPQHLFTSDPAKVERGFPCPRTWSMLSRLLTRGVSLSLEFAAVEGLVGSGPASEFMAFRRMFGSLPNLDKILKNPDSHDPSGEKQDVQIAIATGLARRVTKATADNFLRYTKKLLPEYGVMAVMDAIRANSDSVQGATGFVKWCQENADLFI